MLQSWLRGKLSHYVDIRGEKETAKTSISSTINQNITNKTTIEMGANLSIHADSYVTACEYIQLLWVSTTKICSWVFKESFLEPYK